MGGVHGVDRLHSKCSRNYFSGAMMVFVGNATRDSSYLETLIDQPGVTLWITCSPRCAVMHIAIDLDNQAAFQAHEIDDERSDRMLPAKPQPEYLPPAKQ